MINYFVSNANEILYKSLEHLFIASIALLLGILFAIPIGILITKNRAVAKIVMAFASVLQTIPSFALLSIITIIELESFPL